jgi:hypothetical protein
MRYFWANSCCDKCQLPLNGAHIQHFDHSRCSPCALGKLTYSPFIRQQTILAANRSAALRRGAVLVLAFVR